MSQATRQQLEELDALLQRMLDLPVNNNEIESQGEGESGPRQVEPIMPAAPRRTYPPSYVVVETPTIPTTPGEIAGSERGRDSLPEERQPIGGVEESLSPRSFQPQQPVLPESTEEDWVPLRSSWRPSAQTWKPLAETWEQSRGVPSPTVPPELPRAWVPPSEEPSPIGTKPIISPTESPVVIPPPPVTYGPAVVPPSASPNPIESTKSVSTILLPIVWFNKAFDVCLFPLGPLGAWLKGHSGRGFLGTIGLLALVAALALAAADGIGWTR